MPGWGTYNLTATPFYVNPTLLPGDASLDGTVNFTDLNIVRTNYKQARGLDQGDFNHDGVVNFADLDILLANYNGKFCVGRRPGLRWIRRRSDPGADPGRSDRGSRAVGAAYSLATGLSALLVGPLAWGRRKRKQMRDFRCLTYFWQKQRACTIE